MLNCSRAGKNAQKLYFINCLQKSCNFKIKVV